MQSETGCKINVSQASGADIEREIGLVGSRQAIDNAKRAIWDKVEQVVRTEHLSRFQVLISDSVRRIPAGDVTTATGTGTGTTITTTHSSHSPHLRVTEPHPLHSLLWLQRTLPAVPPLTLMPYMADTRTISLCGMHRSHNSSKEGSRPKHLPVPRRVHGDAHAADASSIDACLHDRFWISCA
jgi:hypothetical protein